MAVRGGAVARVAQSFSIVNLSHVSDCALKTLASGSKTNLLELEMEL